MMMGMTLVGMLVFPGFWKGDWPTMALDYLLASLGERTLKVESNGWLSGDRQATERGVTQWQEKARFFARFVAFA